jgi:hypothetical protein
MWIYFYGLSRKQCDLENLLYFLRRRHAEFNKLFDLNQVKITSIELKGEMDLIHASFGNFILQSKIDVENC